MTTINNTARRAARLLAIAGLSLGLQGCAIYEYIFGGPDPEDLPQIQMKVPGTAVATPDTILNRPAAPRYPTPWRNEEILD